MTAKYTPGPWIEGLDESGVVVVKRDTAHAIARLGPIWEQTEETMANARLIAAAPEQQAKIDALADALETAVRTLAAAREMLGVFEDHGGHDGLGGKGYVATLDQIDEASAGAIAALRAAGRLP